MKFELNSIGYWSVIKVSFIVNLLLGFIMGLFFAIFIGLMFSLISNFAGMAGMPMFDEEMPPIGLLLILYPFMFGFGGAVINTIAAVIAVFIYNMVGKFLGGLELELNEIRLQPVTAPSVSAYADAQAAQTYRATSPPPPPPPQVQPLPPDMTPPDSQTDSRDSTPKKDEGV